MAYESYCAACTYLNERCWCEKKGEDHNGSDPKCYYFIEAYSRSYSARKNLYDAKPSSGGCYLTTIMCKLLGYEDDNYYLNTLRKFRDNIMQKNPNYIPLLNLYDTVGPVISKELADDPNGKQIATVFFNKYISQAVMAIEEDKNKTAIDIYVAMTHALAKKYNVEIRQVPMMEIDAKDINPSTLGHGRVRNPKYNY